jgi:urease accessory protein UreH
MNVVVKFRVQKDARIFWLAEDQFVFRDAQ